VAVPSQIALDGGLPDPTATAGRLAEGRSLWRIAGSRLRRDKVALASAAFIVLVALVAVFAPLLVALLGDPPSEPHYDLLDPYTTTPLGPLGGISVHHLLGVEPVNGRDVFSRVVYGARISLLVATLATLTSVVIGTTMGLIAGYLGGWLGGLISRLMDLLLAFPLLLFAIAIVAVIPDSAFGLQGSTLRIGVLVFIIGFFNWPYIGRIVRGQTLSLAERDFVAAARGTGAGPIRIMVHELLPNLVAPILVYSTLLIPTNILFEAALSYLGVGVRPPTASWGDMLSTAADGLFSVDPMFMIVPGVAIFLTVLAFNLFGDALRDAFDPRGG
jgi:peptide/nickel transport system permease protein/oligopeptide transport system permease protein